MNPSFSASCHCIHPDTHVREVQTHRLTPKNCDVCECPIAGKMFNCTACDSDLHPFCKTAPQCLASDLHPVPGHPLTRLTRDHVMGHAPNRRCKVCCEDIKGVSYTCAPCNFDVHPQCSQLPRVVPSGSGPHCHELVLQVTEVVDRYCHVCHSRCGRWAYSCGDCSVYVHFSCIVEHAAAAIAGPSVGPAVTASRGLDRNYGRFDHGGRGQRYGGPPPHHYYNYGGFQQHNGYQQWGGNYNYNYDHHHNNYNNNHHVGCGGLAAGVGGIVGRIDGSLAVSLLCQMVSNLLQPGVLDLFC